MELLRKEILLNFLLTLKSRYFSKTNINTFLRTLKRNEPSLNNILYGVPCLLPYLYDILLQFRTGKIGLLGDIKQAFWQVEIAEEHRDLLVLLKFTKITSLRFTRAVFGLTSSPFLLNGTIKIHVSKYLPVPHYTDIVKKLILNL